MRSLPKPRRCSDHPVELLDGAAEVVRLLARTHSLWLITKGDLRDQERKLAKSGLAGHFAHWEIVSEKNAATYARILRRLQVRPEQFLMVGNSLKSDILPALDLGASAVLIPYPLLWQGEKGRDDATERGRPSFPTAIVA